MPTSGAAAAVVVGSGGPVKIKQEMPEGEGTQVSLMHAIGHVLYSTRLERTILHTKVNSEELPR
jgi:hypothetical protein